MADQPASPPPAKPTLADLRREIDRIDAGMHELLMERGRIIDTLIARQEHAGRPAPPSAPAAKPG